MRHDSDRHRHHDEDEDLFETIIKMVVVVVVGGVVIFGAAGFLDSTFGWGLQEWLTGLLNKALDSGG